MPRVIAQNRIPRVNLVNRNITFRPVDANPLGAGSVGDITWAASLPNIPNQVYRSALAPSEILMTAQYPALLNVQGGIAGGVYRTSPNVDAGTFFRLATVMWNGGLYNIVGGQKGITHRPTALGPNGAALNALPGNWFAQSLAVTPSRMFIGVRDFVTPAGGIVTVTDDVTFSAPVNIGQDSQPLAWGIQFAVEAVAGSIYVCTVTSPDGGVFRTINAGTSWTRITTNLTGVNWATIWRASNGNLHMLDTTFRLATSADNGATWSVVLPSGISGDNWRNVTLDYVGRRAFLLTGSSAIYSLPMDNAVAGYTQIQPNGSTPTNGLIIAGSNFLYTLGSASPPRAGVWWAPLSAPQVTANWKGGAVLPPIAGLGFISGQALYEIEGLLNIDLLSTAGAFPATTQLADLTNSFDRYLITDPNLPSGKKPFTRVQ